jgi:hypothetical protein
LVGAQYYWLHHHHPVALLGHIAAIDIRHSREFYELLDLLPLAPEHEAMIGLSALHTLHAGIDVLSAIYHSVTSG